MWTAFKWWCGKAFTSGTEMIKTLAGPKDWRHGCKEEHFQKIVDLGWDYVPGRVLKV